MIRATSSTILVFATIACSGGGDDAADRSAEPAAAGRAELFSESIEGEPCEILTTQIVAETVGAPVEGIRQSSMGMSCSYSWGDSGLVIFYGLRVFDTPQGAIDHLANEARNLTGEELATMWDEIVESAEDERGADAVGDEARRGTAEGVTFDVAPGLGDRAIWESGTSNATVQIANAVIDLQATTGRGLEADRELTSQLFDAVVSTLR